MQRGGLLAQFNMGSTVVVLLPPGAAAGETASRPVVLVRIGVQALGRMTRAWLRT